jgi:hypothetical protein
MIKTSRDPQNPSYKNSILTSRSMFIMFYKHEEKNRAIQIDTTQQTPEVRQPKKESKFDTRHFIPNT